MRITREEALAFASAKKKLLTVKKGQAWLFCPYMSAAAYHSVHWDHQAEQSVQCEGEGCTYCPHPPNRKVHLPSLVCKKPYRIETVDSLKFPEGAFYHAAHWGDKIVELTAACFAALEAASQPNQLAIAWRPGPRRNGQVYFRWVEGVLKGIPPELEFLDVDKILPGVIGGTYRNSHQTVALDNSEGSRIKHKLAYPTFNEFDGTPGSEVPG